MVKDNNSEASNLLKWIILQAELEVFILNKDNY